VQWSITFDGGIIIPSQKSGTFSTLAPEAEETVNAFVIGIGMPEITVQVTCAERSEVDREVQGFVFLFFVLGI
jgi:hypothetical protein